MVGAIQKELSELEVVFRNDSTHVPYGNRSIEEIYGFTLPIIRQMVSDDCAVIVIACNTVTTNLIDRLRREITVPLIGMEPMVKPAALASKSKIIAVCATPRTLSSRRYQWLKGEYAKGVTVLEPDCSDWSYMIETDSVDRGKLVESINGVCEAGADQIVLGCTHYHWIETIIREIASGRAEVIQPEKPVIEQLKRTLETLS